MLSLQERPEDRREGFYQSSLILSMTQALDVEHRSEELGRDACVLMMRETTLFMRSKRGV